MLFATTQEVRVVHRFELIHEERVGRMARPVLVQRGLERSGSGATAR
jgi:hypothetical protein